MRDVECKRRVDLVPRLAEIEANLQAERIGAHQAELVAERANVDRLLNRAKRFIARNRQG